MSLQFACGTMIAERTYPVMQELRDRLAALRDRVAHVMVRL